MNSSFGEGGEGEEGRAERSTRGEEEAKNLEAQCHGLLDKSPLRDSLPLLWLPRPAADRMVPT